MVEETRRKTYELLVASLVSSGLIKLGFFHLRLTKKIAIHNWTAIHYSSV